MNGSAADSERPLAIFLMGPTGAGKSDLAIQLASDLPLEIISVDSAMVFRELDIGTAKPSRLERSRIPHWLIDVRNPDERYSAADFRQDALQGMNAVWSKGGVPLLVGGTGLYFRALEQGLSSLPSANASVRAAINARAQDVGWQALHEELKQKDPVAADRIHPNDPQRIQRALEVYDLTGRPISAAWAAGRTVAAPFDTLKVIWAPAARRHLDAQLDQRFMRMIESGLMEECLGVRQRYVLKGEMPARRLVGYRQVWDHLDGKLSRNDMVKLAVGATQQLAKRQYTWLRSEGNAIWLEAGSKASEEALRELIVAAILQRSVVTY